MATIALIGSDGSGKTTIAEAIQSSLPVPVKYLYMGPSIDSSNHTLPTTRLYQWLRRLRRERLPGGTHHPRRRIRSLEERDTIGKVGAAARLVYRLSEEWYRQIVSWVFQLRGYVVLYDRHFVFEFAPVDGGNMTKPPRLSDRIHTWILRKVYPQPDLVLFLDAPSEVLRSRKPEATIEYLDARRTVVSSVGRSMNNFVRIDASQPLDQVIEDVLRASMQSLSLDITGLARNSDGSVRSSGRTQRDSLEQ